MAFGYEYLMVYLPEFNPESFLLFVHNPAGSTKLRDYSCGREKVLGQPPLSHVLKSTEFGKTRFREDPYTVTEADGVSHWRARIADCNSRYLSKSRTTNFEPVIVSPPSVASSSREGVHGRALRGSRLQIQDYVNSRQGLLNHAILEALPAQLAAVVREIRWESPLVADDYAEFRDGDFLDRIGLGDFKRELAAFWPAKGPSWDALATVTTTNLNSVPIMILIEAKSHIPEIYGNGCQAGADSKERIEESLAKAKKWCGVAEERDWTGPLYQSANRIAHLYFIRELLRRPAWLINIYFISDPIRPTTQEAWLVEIGKVKAALGLSAPIPGLLEMFLPALGLELREGQDEKLVSPTDHAVERRVESRRDRLERDGASGECLDVNDWAQSDSGTEPSDFERFSIWRERWTALADYAGTHVPNVESRIDQLLQLWSEPIPGSWQRGKDLQLLSNRYRRGDKETPHLGEHAIEHAILVSHFEQVTCLGKKLVDGINAFPLCMDVRRIGRNGKCRSGPAASSKRWIRPTPIPVRGEGPKQQCLVRSRGGFASIQTIPDQP
jgi:hypothetical protein